MKKVLIFSFALMTAVTVSAQSLQDISGMMDKQKFGDAKTAIDKFVADPKNASSADGYYFKGRVYNSLSRDASVSKADAYTYKLAAFDAFKKYQSLDKLDMRLKTEFHKSYLDIYLGLYDVAAQYFNDKNYAEAYNTFSKAEEIENFILDKNYQYDEMKLNRLDTALVMNIAASALQAKDTVNAVKTYKRIVDAGIATKDNESIYEFLASHYSNTKDDANYNAVIAKAKAAYPTNNFWNALELERIGQSGDKTALFAKYDDLFSKDPTNFNNGYNYAVELYNDQYTKEGKKGETATKDKLTAVLKQTIPTDKGIDATMLMANHLFNYAANYSTEAALVKSTKPEDIKKKKELNTLAIAKMDEAIPYAENAIKYYAALEKPTIKQRINYQLAAGYLVDIYNVKANPKKSAEYEKIRDSIKFN